MWAIVYPERQVLGSRRRDLYQFSAPETGADQPLGGTVESRPGWQPTPLHVALPPRITSFLYFGQTERDATTPIGEHGLTGWVPRPFAAPSTVLLGWGSAHDASVPIEPDTTPPWTPRPLPPSPSQRVSTFQYYYGNPAQDQAAPDEPTAGLPWTPRPLRQPRPEPTPALYYFSATARDTSAAAEPELFTPWAPRRVRAATPPAIPFALYYSNAPNDASAPPEPERPVSYAPRPLTEFKLPPYWLYAWTTAHDVPPPTVETGAREGWRKWTFQPPSTTLLYFGQANDLVGPNPPPPPTPEAEGSQRYTPTPLRVPRIPLPAVLQYYFQSTAEDFGEAPGSQFLVFWQYRTRYEERTRQFFLRNLQGPPQDTSSTAEASTIPLWTPRSIKGVRPPLSAFANLYFDKTAQDTSAPTQPETTPMWVAQRVGRNAVPRSAFLNLYLSATARDTNAPVEPETTPQWAIRRLGQNAVPRSAFLNLFSSGADVPIIPETVTQWSPKPLAQPPPPRLAFLLFYSSTTAQDDNAPVEATLFTWYPRPLIKYPLPPYWLYQWYGLANAEQSASSEIGLHGWQPTPLTVAHVPRGAYLYYRSDTAQDTDAPPPPPPPTGHGSEFPQWLRRARLLLYHP